MNDNSIVFAPTNGAGLGHLTRTLAIARRIKKINPNKKIVFFSTSPAMHLILREGFMGYYLPSKMLFPQDVTASQWNELLIDELNIVFQLHRTEMIIFDGAYAYQGLDYAMRNANYKMKKIWIKKDEIKKSVSQVTSFQDTYFDKLVVPGEAGKNYEQKKANYYYTNPIIYLDRSELLDRELILKQWNIPKEYKVVYVQLGAGNINDIKSTLGMIISILKNMPNVFIVIGESIVGKRLDVYDKRIMVLRDYPNSRFSNAFDMAITACGYNTFHELMYFGVPSIFIPNEATKSDNQAARSMRAERAGAALTLMKPTLEIMKNAIENLLDTENNEKMRRASRELVLENGADELASVLLNGSIF